MIKHFEYFRCRGERAADSDFRASAPSSDEVHAGITTGSTARFLATHQQLEERAVTERGQVGVDGRRGADLDLKERAMTERGQDSVDDLDYFAVV